jgi:hypothetical protein
MWKNSTCKIGYTAPHLFLSFRLYAGIHSHICRLSGFRDKPGMTKNGCNGCTQFYRPEKFKRPRMAKDFDAAPENLKSIWNEIRILEGSKNVCQRN